METRPPKTHPILGKSVNHGPDSLTSSAASRNTPSNTPQHTPNKHVKQEGCETSGKYLRKWLKTGIIFYIWGPKWPKNQNSTSTNFWAILLCTFKPNMGKMGWNLREPIWVETRQIWGIWKLRPAYSPETPNLGQNRWCFVPCDLEIWWVTLENNKASLLCCFKLCATFHSHWWIQTGVTVRKRPNLCQNRRFF